MPRRAAGPDFLEHMAALVTLTEGASRDTIERVIREELDADGSTGNPRAIAAALREVLPDEVDADSFAPILPYRRRGGGPRRPR